MFALGISVIYRASRVLNLAHGAMAMIPAYVFFTLVSKAGVPTLLALPVAVISGAALGVGVEMVFVRRLRPQGPTAQTVGTVAVTGLLIALGGVLLAAVTNLDPYNLTLEVLPAFVAVLLGGMENLLGAVWGAAIAGLAFGLVPVLEKLPGIGGVFLYSGAPQLILTILAL